MSHPDPHKPGYESKQHYSLIRSLARSNGRSIAILLLGAVFLAPDASGQQSYVGRWDAYGGFMRLMQPSINLAEPGFNLQVGMRLTDWVTGGFDYTVGTGQNILEPGMLLPSLQKQLAAQLNDLAAIGLVPAGYQLRVPVNAKTQSFQIGPDFPFRHFQAVTFFVRPNLGALQVIATPRPADPIAKLVVSQLTPAGRKTDWTYFYGFGGGLEFNVNKHFALRFQADFAHDHFFNDLLRAGNTIRFSVGPALQWGENMAGR